MAELAKNVLIVIKMTLIYRAGIYVLILVNTNQLNLWMGQDEPGSVDDLTVTPLIHVAISDRQTEVDHDERLYQT